MASEKGIKLFGTCTVCEKAMEYLDSKIGTDRRKDKVEGAVHSVCNHLPKLLSRPCNKMIDEHGDAIINLLLQNVLPKAVCTAIRLCTVPVQAELQVTEVIPEPMASEKGIKLFGTCTVCEKAMEYLDSKIGTDRRKDKVEDAVHSVCNHLPKLLSRPCNKMIDEHGDAIIKLLLENVVPKAVCTAIRLCTASVEAELQVTEVIPEPMASEEGIKLFGTCTVCEKAMEYLDSKIGTNRRKDKVEDAVHSVCNHLPKLLSRPCNKMIDEHGDAIIKLLLENVMPKAVCTAIRLCTASVEAELQAIDVVADTMASKESIEEDRTCSVCKVVMNFIDKELGTDRARRRVESIVRHVCMHLPLGLSRSCKAFIDKHSDAIIDVITHDVSPKEVCGILRFCELFMEQELKASVKQCSLCKEVITVIDEILGNQKVDNSIKKVVSKVCKHVPASQQSECQDMIDYYGQSIINLFTQSIKSNKICGKIGLCATEDYSTVSLDGSRIKRSYEENRIKHCTWGPAYVCSTNETALECKAVEHCKQNVWKADFAPP